MVAEMTLAIMQLHARRPEGRVQRRATRRRTVKRWAMIWRPMFWWSILWWAVFLRIMSRWMIPIWAILSWSAIAMLATHLVARPAQRASADDFVGRKRVESGVQIVGGRFEPRVERTHLVEEELEIQHAGQAADDGRQDDRVPQLQSQANRVNHRSSTPGRGAWK
jgi:hypothetical protein